MSEQHVPVILLVDDDPVITRLLEVNFRLVGFRVAAVARGDVALERAPRGPPSAIVLDVMLPGLGGYEVCRQMRLIPSLADVPVVFLTARSPDEDQAAQGGLGTGGLRQQAVRARRSRRTHAPAGRGAATAVIEERLLELIRAALETAAARTRDRRRTSRARAAAHEAEGARRLRDERRARTGVARRAQPARGGRGDLEPRSRRRRSSSASRWRARGS